MSSFCQFFDIQMAMFWRVRFVVTRNVKFATKAAKISAFSTFWLVRPNQNVFKTELRQSRMVPFGEICLTLKPDLTPMVGILTWFRHWIIISLIPVIIDCFHPCFCVLAVYVYKQKLSVLLPWCLSHLNNYPAVYDL